MQCSDLDRYLEAHLDERLGRGRSAILRRHLSACSSCRARVMGLRRFEREMNQKLRSMRVAESVWNGLELDLVRSTNTTETDLPDKKPTVIRNVPAVTNPRQIVNEIRQEKPAREEIKVPKTNRVRQVGRYLVGTLLVVAAVGTIYRLIEPLIEVHAIKAVFMPESPPSITGSNIPAGTPTDPTTGSATGIQTFAELDRDLLTLKGGAVLEHATTDAAALRDWWLSQTGILFPSPPEMEGMALIGGSTGRSGGDPIVRAHFSGGATKTVVAIEPVSTARLAGNSGQAADTLETAQAAGQESWISGGFEFTLLPNNPPAAGDIQKATIAIP